MNINEEREKLCSIIETCVENKFDPYHFIKQTILSIAVEEIMVEIGIKDSRKCAIDFLIKEAFNAGVKYEELRSKYENSNN